MEFSLDTFYRMGRKVIEMEFIEMAAPVVVLAAGAAIGLVSTIWGTDSRDGFYEPSTQGRPARWFISPR